MKNLKLTDFKFVLKLIVLVLIVISQQAKAVTMTCEYTRYYEAVYDHYSTASVNGGKDLKLSCHYKCKSHLVFKEPKGCNVAPRALSCSANGSPIMNEAVAVVSHTYYNYDFSGLVIDIYANTYCTESYLRDSAWASCDQISRQFDKTIPNRTVDCR